MAKAFFFLTRETIDVNEPAQKNLFCTGEAPHPPFKIFNVTSITNIIHIKMYLQTQSLQHSAVNTVTCAFYL